MYKKIISILITMAVLIAMCGCENGVGFGKNNKDESVHETSKNVNFAVSDIVTMNPACSMDEDTYYLSRLLYQSLFVLDDTFTPVADLAASHKISKSGKSVEIKLKSGARFSDGEKVTSEDVKFSIEAYQKGGKYCRYASCVDGIRNVKTDGASNVKIVFEEGEGSLAKLTFPILPSHKYDLSQMSDRKASFKPVGSGPYKMTSRTDKGFILKPNSKYDGTVPENQLNFTYYDGKAEIMNLLSGNLVSFTIRTELDRQTEIGNCSLRNGEFTSNVLVAIGFNCNKSYLSSEKVRQAICLAVDSDDILQKSYYAGGILTDSVYCPGYLGMNNNGDLYPFDIKKARDVLSSAGWKDQNKDGYLEPGKKPVKMVLLTEDRTELKKSAKFICADLEELGIECETKAVSEKAFKKALKKGEFDLYIGEITFSPAYDVSDLIGGNLDYTGLEDRKLEKAVREASRCMEPEEMLKKAEEIRSIMKETVSIYPMFYKTYSYVISDELSGEVHPTSYDIYNGCCEWQSEYVIEQPVEDKEE